MDRLLCSRKTLPIEIYIVHKTNTNRTQTLRRIRLRKYFTDMPAEDSYSLEKMRSDVDIVKSQDDLYSLTLTNPSLFIYPQKIS